MEIRLKLGVDIIKLFWRKSRKSRLTETISIGLCKSVGV